MNAAGVSAQQKLFVEREDRELGQVSLHQVTLQLVSCAGRVCLHTLLDDEPVSCGSHDDLGLLVRTDAVQRLREGSQCRRLSAVLPRTYS